MEIFNLASKALLSFLSPVLYFFLNSKQNEKQEKFCLQNGLEVLIIQNRNLKNSKLVLHLDVGNIYDPPEMPGFTHLVEHLISHRSSKYTKKNEIMKFVSDTHSYISISTGKERMEFDVITNESKLMKIADMIAWAVHDPLFDEEDIKNEIEVINQEYKGYLKNELHLRGRLKEMAIDKSFPEHLFLCGNKETLTVDNIQTKLKEYHSKHFTPDRMKLVICSKNSIEESKKVAEIFNLIPKRTSKELSLVSEPVHVKFSEQFAGHVVKYLDEQEKHKMFVTIIVPSTINVNKYRQAEYFIEIIKNFSKIAKKNHLNNLVSEIGIFYEKSKRTISFYLNFELTKQGESKVNEILNALHIYIHSQRPNTDIIESIKTSLLLLTNQLSASEKCMLEAFVFFYCPNQNFQEFMTQCEFNEEAIQNMLDLCKDIKNWTVNVTTNDLNLPNKEEYFMIQYSNPEPIQLSHDYSNEQNKSVCDEEMNNILSERKLKEEIETELKTSKSKSVIHKSLDHGQYSLLFDKKCGDTCQVKLTFYSKLTAEQMVGSLVYWHLLIKYLKMNYPEFGENLFSTHLNLFPETSIIIASKRIEILNQIKLIFEVIKAYKPKEEEIAKTKKELKSFFITKLKRDGTYVSLFSAFLNRISNCPVPFEYIDLIDNAECLFYPEFYINIQSSGLITEAETKAIYDMTKSSASFKPLELIDLTTKKYLYQTFDQVNRSFLAVYQLDSVGDRNDLPTGKKFAIALLLQVILSSDFFTFLRSVFPIAYRADCEILRYHTKILLMFSTMSSYSTERISEVFSKFKQTIPKIIENITDEELREIKENLGTSQKIQAIENIDSGILLILMESIGIYDLNILSIIREQINSVSKQDLLEYAAIFNNEPIILSSTNSKVGDDKNL